MLRGVAISRYVGRDSRIFSEALRQANIHTQVAEIEAGSITKGGDIYDITTTGVAANDPTAARN
jgi:hypothetical protein